MREEGSVCIIHISNDVLKNKEFFVAAILNTPMCHGHTAYVKIITEQDRLHDQTTLIVFWSDTGSVILNDYENMIESNVEYHKKLNSQYKLIKTELGYDKNDFEQKRISARLTFDFTQNE